MRTLLWAVLWLVSATPCMAVTVGANGNTRPAGQLEGDVLTVRLVADVGSWRPKGAQSEALEVAAFGEEGAELSAPGPLIRVREGTTVVLTLRNAMTSALRVNGFCARPGNCDTVTVAAGASHEFRFSLNAPGTYFYLAKTGAGPLVSRQSRDTQLGGAIVVDPREGSPADRVFVISAFGDPPPPEQPMSAESDIFSINGASWPHTEKLYHKVGDPVRWRIINLSATPHPMHLHGFHFSVEATGDIVVEQRLAQVQQRTVVTEVVEPGHTFMMQWIPERPGNWLFHCHMMAHMSPMVDGGHADGAAGMAGLVLGILVTGSAASKASNSQTSRQLSLVLREEPNRYGTQSGFRMDLKGADAPRVSSGPVPGPVIVLTRSEPVEITVVNLMSEPTAMHWHGIELDSYFDGVPDWSGNSGSLAPAILPGQSFVVKFTPPRAGTFIYHTHWHNDAQLAGGLYGPLIVIEPGERYDPETDHIAIIGLSGAPNKNERSLVVLNGSTKPDPIVMRAGKPNRLRLINITANSYSLWTSLSEGVPFRQKMWKPLAKDGATLPVEQTDLRPARQRVAVGETYDFEIQPSESRWLWLEVRGRDGEWLFQAPISIR